MTAIRIEDFGGMIPRKSARLLPQNFAQIATDTKLFSGELRGWNQPLLRQQLDGTGIQTVYRIPGVTDTWIESTYSNVHIQKGSLVNDAYDRYYWTAGEDDVPRYNTQARIANGDDPYRLGIPAPSTAPGGSATGGASALEVTRVYVYTFVSEYGEESAPSPPFTITCKVDATVTLTSLEVETDIPNYADRALNSTNGATKRVYRTITSTSGHTTFFLVPTTTGDDDIPMSQTTHASNAEDSTVAYNSLLESNGWNEPPDELEGLIVHPNGFMVGFVGRDLYFSEPYRPHAWPAEYVLSCDFEIMGLGVVGNTIGVATKSNPYGCTGIHPSALSLTKSTTVEPCLSKKGVVTLPDGIMYPSNNGLAWLNPVGAKVITRQFMTKEEWQTQFRPTTINACRYEFRYMAFNCSSCGFIYDPVEQKSAVVDITRINTVTDVYTDVYTGLVYTLENDSVFEWDPAGYTVPITYVWKSRVFEFAKPLNMGAGIIKFASEDLETDDEYIELLTAANAAIEATIPTNKLGGINYRGFNSRRKINVASYLDELFVAKQEQSGAFNGSDLTKINELQTTVPLTQITVWADGREVFQEHVLNARMFRLPTGFKAHTYEIQVRSNTDVYSIAMAETPKELRIV